MARSQTHRFLTRRITRGIGILLALAFAVVGIWSLPVQAQDIEPRHTDPTWQAQYWNNPNLEGQPTFTREENALNHDWDYGSPHESISADDFSARWTRYIDVTPGNYEFTAVTDDGMRVWVDNELVIDAWQEHPPTTYTGTIYLGPGHHLVRVEYFERAQRAVAKVSWRQVTGQPTPTPQPPSATGPWQAEYFNNMSLSGNPVLVRQESAVNHDWGYGSPEPGTVSSDHFSARWSRNLDLSGGNYRFHVRPDDGARLFVNGHTLIDAWYPQAPTTYSGDIFLPGGPVSVQLEYFEQTERAEIQLSWQRLDGSQEPTPPSTQWSVYRNNTLAVAFEYPSNWTRDTNYGATNERYSGPGGFFHVGVMGATNIDAAASSEAYHVLRPYGSNPAIESLTADGQAARLILPSSDQASGMQQQAALIVQYPQRLYLGQAYYDFFILHASQPYIRHMAQTLDFISQSTPAPTPTPRPPSSSAVIVDDLSNSFVRGGSESNWSFANEGYNGHLAWTQNNYSVQAGYNWGRWYPNLQARRYEVSVYIPNRYSTTGQARYWISHADGYTLRVVDQSAYGGRWVSLGTYRFRGTDLDYVSLADVTYESNLSRLVAWDAMRWEPR